MVHAKSFIASAEMIKPRRTQSHRPKVKPRRAPFDSAQDEEPRPSKCPPDAPHVPSNRPPSRCEAFLPAGGCR